MNRLDRYIARAIVSATGVVALVVGAMASLMLFISETGHLGDGHFGLFQLLLYVAMMLPSRMSLVLPVVALLGSLLALGAMASGSELVVIRSAGVSMRRLAVSVAVGGLVLALVAIALSECLGPVGVRNADNLRQRALHGGIDAPVGQGLWLREDKTVLHIRAMLPDHRILGLDVYRLDASGQLSEALTAKQARLEGHRLVIDHPRFTRITTHSTQTGAPDTLTLKVDIDPQVLRLAVTKPGELSSLGLWRFIDYLQRNGIAAGNYRLALWRNIVTPFEVWILVVFALPFALGSLRSGGAGQRLFVGGLVGVVFFLANEIVGSTAPVYGVPPWLAASLPTLLLGAVTVAWMRRLS